MNFHSRVRHAVNPDWILLIRRSRILLQDLNQCCSFFSRNLFQIHFREIHIQFIIFLFLPRNRLLPPGGYHVWKVGLDIVDWRHIQKIRTFHDQHRTFFFPEFTPISFTEESPIGFGRNGERVAKTPTRLLPPKPRWTYRRAPGIPDRFRKFPDQPQIIIRLDFPQCIRILIFRQKMDFCPGIRKITLSRNPRNFSTKSDLIFAICFICIVLFSINKHHHKSNCQNCRSDQKCLFSKHFHTGISDNCTDHKEEDDSNSTKVLS